MRLAFLPVLCLATLSALAGCDAPGATELKPSGSNSREQSPSANYPEGNPDSENTTSPAQKPEVLIIGDSMMQFGIGPALKSDLQKKGYRVVYYVQKSTGLTWTHFFDWQHKSEELLAEGDFEAIVVMLGSNDGRWLKYQGKRLEYGPDVELWWQQYSLRFDEFFGRLCHETTRVYWVGMPPMKPQGYHSKTRLFNAFYEQKIRGSGCGKYIATDYLSKERPVRWSDGIHVSNSGGRTVAERIQQATGL